MAVENNRWGIIYNPKAGTRKVQKRWSQIRDYLQSRGVEFDYVQSESFKSVERLAGMLANNGYRTIVVVGGDGALNDAVNGIMHAPNANVGEIALGLIPNGIGNDYAHCWEIDFDDYRKAIEVIIARRTRKVDVGVCSYTEDNQPITRYFLNAVQIGLGARIVSISNNTYRFWGMRALAFNLAMVRLSFERTLYRMHLRINDEHIRDNLMAVCVGCARGYGLTPNAVPYNGWLDVSVIYRPEWWQLFSGLWMLLRGRILNYKLLRPYRTKQVLLLRANNAQISADGRILPRELPLQIGVKQEALQFIIP